jgi:hypothetical protein
MADPVGRGDFQATAAIDVTALRGLPQIDRVERQIDHIIFKTAAIAGERDVIELEDVHSAAFARLSRRFNLGLNTSEKSFLQMRAVVVHRLVVAAQRQHSIPVDDADRFGRNIASLVAQNSLGVREIKGLIDGLFAALEKVHGDKNLLGLLIFTIIWLNAYRLAQLHRDWCAAGGHPLTSDPAETERMVQDFLARLEDGSVTVGILSADEEKFALAHYNFDDNMLSFSQEYLEQLTYESMDPILLVGQQVYNVAQDAGRAEIGIIANEAESEIFGMGALRILYGYDRTQAFLTDKAAGRRADWRAKAEQGVDSVTGIFNRDYLDPANQGAQQGIAWRLQGLELAEERLKTGQIDAQRWGGFLVDHARYRLMHRQVEVARQIELDYQRDPASFKAQWHLLDLPAPGTEIFPELDTAADFLRLTQSVMPRLLGWMVVLYHEQGRAAAEAFYRAHYGLFFEGALLPGLLALHARLDGFPPQTSPPP